LKKIISDLDICREIFQDLKMKWVIIDGIVLGYVRHKGIIPWDTDVDLAVLEEITPERWKQLYNSLRKQGVSIKPVLRDYVYGRRKGSIGIWFYHKVGNYYEAYPETTPGLKFVEKREWYDKLQIVDFLNDKYPMPNHLENYLNCRYGDWKNERYTHDEWRVEKFGTLKQDEKSQKSIWTKSRCGKNGDLWPKIMFIEDTL